jgi:DUF2971 family protein
VCSCFQQVQLKKTTILRTIYIYLWSHYGNGHRGAAIEFNTALLTRAVLTKIEKLGGEEVDQIEVWWEIKYPPEMPKITCEAISQFIMNDTENPDEKAWDATELAKIMRLRCRSKSIGWQIENEWRLMWRNDETRLKIQRLDLLDDTVTAIYLGCLIDGCVKENLIFETKRRFPNAKVFMGKRTRGAFALELERLF